MLAASWHKEAASYRTTRNSCQSAAPLLYDGHPMSPSLHCLLWKIGLSAAVTQTTAEERACLTRHASGRKVLAEIGVFEGVTTCVLRDAMAADGVLFAIDPYPLGRLGVSFHEWIAHSEVERITNGSVIWIRATGREAVADPRLAATMVDFVFVDGDHSWQGIKGDWNAWSPKIVPGGVMAFHDSRNSHGAGSERFTTEVIVKDPRFTVVDTQDRLTVIQPT